MTTTESAVTSAVPKESADREIREYRELLAPPDHWEPGFDIKSILGGLFVGMIMTPASMYMSLVQGADIGPAAQWVTILLFIEVARRAFTTLRRPEVFVLYYIAGVSLVMSSPLHGPLWNQFMAQSSAFRATGITTALPSWVAPTSPDVLGVRSFFRAEWLAPIGIIALGLLVQRLDHISLGYVLYRLTSDVEKLPFPVASVSAQGVSALADASSGQASWRWRVFSFGTMLGLAFGAVYVALPAISAAFLPEPLSILPLPFKDLTAYTEHYFPAVPMMVSFDLGLVILGMVLPYWAMVGAILGLVATFVLNAALYHTGILHTWRPGIGGIRTLNSNYLDFYLSWGLGLTAAITVIGFAQLARTFTAAKPAGVSSSPKRSWRDVLRPPPGRGDVSVLLALAVYVVTTAATILLTCALLTAAHHENPLNSPVTAVLVAILAFYGFVYTPILAYASVRMEGLIGHGVAVPFVREATFILSGYKGAAIWFAPFPIWTFNEQTRHFRAAELTGTRLTSILKSEAFMFPVIIVAMVAFSQFIWHIAPVPSSAFPYAQQFWESFAYRQSLTVSATLPGGEHGPFFEAFSFKILLAALATILALYSAVSWYGLPVLLVYGVIRGMDATTPQSVVPMFVGALLGRFYFRKRFGKMWPQYVVVFAAGYACGVGLVMMLSLGIVFITKSVTQSAF